MKCWRCIASCDSLGCELWPGCFLSFSFTWMCCYTNLEPVHWANFIPESICCSKMLDLYAETFDFTGSPSCTYHERKSASHRRFASNVYSFTSHTAVLNPMFSCGNAYRTDFRRNLGTNRIHDLCQTCTGFGIYFVPVLKWLMLFCKPSLH